MLTSSLSSAKDGRLVRGVLAKGAGRPPSALILSAVLSTLPAVLPAEDAAESTKRCAPRMESAAESTTCSAGPGAEYY